MKSWAGAAVLAVAAVVCGAVAQAAEPDAAQRETLRVCKDPNNMPFANLKGEGFEDRIAELLAQCMGRKVEYFTFPQRLGFIRNTLRHKLPGKDYPCDVVMGVPDGWGQVASTKPYYRSTYVLVFAPSRAGLEGVRTEADFLALPEEKLAALRIGIFDRSPGSAWLVKHDLVDLGVPYRNMNPNPDDYPGAMVERDLTSGKIDVAVLWGPIGGYFARQAKAVELRVVPLESEVGVRFDYAMSMGVRRGEDEWKDRIQGLIDENHDEIIAILKDYGVPLLSLGTASGGTR